ncbi:hypothetical protein D3C87_1654030 [compost metagenome]
MSVEEGEANAIYGDAIRRGCGLAYRPGFQVGWERTRQRWLRECHWESPLWYEFVIVLGRLS